MVEQLGARCQPAGGGPITNSGLVGGGFSPSQAFSLTCPAGQAVTGILGGAGEVIDSIALVCGTASLPAGPPTITGMTPASPVAAGYGQLVSFTGTNLPPADPTPSTDFPRPVEQQVVITSGASSYFTDLVWGASPTRWMVRLTPGIPAGPATVTISAPGGSPSSNAFPFTIATTPAAPVLNSVLSACNGSPISTINSGGAFAVEADGIDTGGDTDIVWTRISAAGGGTIVQTLPTASGGPTGGVCVYMPGGSGTSGPAPTLVSGTWLVQVRTRVAAVPSLLSNAITVTVP